MKVKVVKPFRYCMRIFTIGEVGEVVEVEHPLTFKGKPVYDFYVKFSYHKPIGVFKEQVEMIE